MMKSLFCGAVFLILLVSFSSLAQNKIATIELADVTSAYIDRPGDLYVLQKNNTLKKFDSAGTLLYEKKYNTPPTTFDPRDGARMFKYQKETGQFSFYSEETKQEFSIEPQYAVEPEFVCSAGDHQIWIYDKADYSIKRINPSLQKVLTEARVDKKQFKTEPQFLMMREYQNFLFILEKNSGILIFNSLGIQIKKLPATEIEYFNFLGEELYYKKNDKLIFYDLFDSSMREEPIDPTCKVGLLTDSHTYLVYPNRLEILKRN